MKHTEESCLLILPTAISGVLLLIKKKWIKGKLQRKLKEMN